MRAYVLSTLLLLPACGRSGLDLIDIDSAPTDAATTPAFVGADECADGPRRLFVIDSSGMLSRFRPDTLTFTNVGRLDCPAARSDGPDSMAIRQDGVAWV